MKRFVVLLLVVVSFSFGAMFPAVIEHAKALVGFGQYAHVPFGSVPASNTSSSQKDVNTLFALPAVEIFGSVHPHLETFGPLLVDISGDGVADKVFSKKQNNDNWNQYVALATGQGFETVYKCNYSGNMYYGNCAFAGSGPAPSLPSGSRIVSPLSGITVGGSRTQVLRLEKLYYALPGLPITGYAFDSTSIGEHFSPTFVDMNGDGLADMVYSAPAITEGNKRGFQQFLAFNTGQGFEYAYTCSKTHRWVGGSNSFEAFYSGDCSNDGSTPRLSGSSSSLNPFQVSSGRGGGSSSSLNPNPVAFALAKEPLFGSIFTPVNEQYRSNYGPLFSDVNYDGLADLVISYETFGDYGTWDTWHQAVYVNTGVGFEVPYYCSKDRGSYSGDCVASSP